MKSSVILIILLLLLLLPGCAHNQSQVPIQDQPARTTSSNGVVTVSESSQSSEENQQLKDEIKRLSLENQKLETENQRLSTENQQLEDENRRLETEKQGLTNDLAEATNTLESLQNELPMIASLQSDARNFAAYLEGLPDLPDLPGELKVDRINDVVMKSVSIRQILEALPEPPWFAPPEWIELDEMKDIFIEVTKWMKNLQSLPGFLDVAVGFDALRYQEIQHLKNIADSMDSLIYLLKD